MSGSKDPGTLVLVVGPSGAGKDTLISHAKALLGEGYEFPRRVVTRASSQFEDHDSVDDAGFEEREARGDFALTWRAHGLAYGIPSSIEASLNAGRTVVCNVSRNVVDAARERFDRVRVIVVTADRGVLEERIHARRRDAVVASRKERASTAVRLMPGDCEIDNSGALGEATAGFLRGLRQFSP